MDVRFISETDMTTRQASGLENPGTRGSIDAA